MGSLLTADTGGAQYSMYISRCAGAPIHASGGRPDGTLGRRVGRSGGQCCAGARATRGGGAPSQPRPSTEAENVDPLSPLDAPPRCAEREAATYKRPTLCALAPQQTAAVCSTYVKGGIDGAGGVQLPIVCRHSGLGVSGGESMERARGSGVVGTTPGG